MAVNKIVDIDLTNLSESEESKPKINSMVDYINSESKFTGVRFLKECCVKLKTNILTAATAATYYHKFFVSVNFEDYDAYLIACTCIYLASKVRNDDVKIRDIINVGYHTIHNSSVALALDPYFELRDSLVEAELLLMRMLNFDLHIELPHRHLLFFLNTLKDWVGEKVFQDFPITQTSWAILNDAYYSPVVLKYSPELIATSVVYITLQVYGISVIGSVELYNNRAWYNILHPTCKLQNIWSVCSDIFWVYTRESTLKFL